jgi:DNA-binding MarR family transcriptional regulator
MAALKGELHHNKRLTTEDVLLIRRIYTQGLHTQKSLATFFDVSQSTIRDIVTGRTWRTI